MKQKKSAKFLRFALLAVMAIVLVASLAACGGKGKNPSEPSEPTPPAHEHAYTQVDAKSPTCTQAGNILYYTCSCGKYFDANKDEIELSDTVLNATGHDKVTDGWESDGTSHWHKCNNCDEKLDLDAHTRTLYWIEDGNATCKSQAHHHKECAYCGYWMEEEDYGDFGPHSWNTQNKCDICGTAKPAYDEREGMIYFGSYPQTKVDDGGLIATLSQMSGSNPVKGAAGKWTDYGYYLDTQIDEYMWYIDLEYEEMRYRGIYLAANRSLYSTNPNENKAQNYQSSNGYSVGELYWFKWETIEWRVLKKENGEAFLMSNKILDSQQYFSSISDNRSVNGETVYPNNYKESDIRKWLNDDFLNWAFDDYEQSFIKETLVDNSAETLDDSDTDYACENTTDKVFLPSYADIVNAQYGFNANANAADRARQLKTTDYAQAQGAFVAPIPMFKDNGEWWLRSPYSGKSLNANMVKFNGPTGTAYVYSQFDGVVPALYIAL